MANKPRMFSAEHLEYLKRGIPVWPGDEERIRALVDAGKAGAAPAAAQPVTPQITPQYDPGTEDMQAGRGMSQYQIEGLLADNARNIASQQRATAASQYRGPPREMVPQAQPTGQEMFPPTSPVDQRMAMYEKVRKEFEAKRAAAQTTPVDIPKFVGDVGSRLGNFGGLLEAPSVADLYKKGMSLLPPKTTATAAPVQFPDAQVQPQPAPQPVQGVDPAVVAAAQQAAMAREQAGPAMNTGEQLFAREQQARAQAQAGEREQAGPAMNTGEQVFQQQRQQDAANQWLQSHAQKDYEREKETEGMYAMQAHGMGDSLGLDYWAQGGSPVAHALATGAGGREPVDPMGLEPDGTTEAGDDPVLGYRFPRTDEQSFATEAAPTPTTKSGGAEPESNNNVGGLPIEHVAPAQKAALEKTWGKYAYDPVARRKKFVDQLNQIYKKAAWLDVIAALTGGKSRSEQYIARSVQMLETLDKFDQEERIQNIWQEVYYPDGVYNPPKDQQEAWDRAAKLGASPKLMREIYGSIPAAQATYQWYRKVDGQVEVVQQRKKPEGADWRKGSVPVSWEKKDKIWFTNGDYNVQAKSLEEANRIYGEGFREGKKGAEPTKVVWNDGDGREVTLKQDETPSSMGYGEGWSRGPKGYKKSDPTKVYWTDGDGTEVLLKQTEKPNDPHLNYKGEWSVGRAGRAPRTDKIWWTDGTVNIQKEPGTSPAGDGYGGVWRIGKVGSTSGGSKEIDWLEQTYVNAGGGQKGIKSATEAMFQKMKKNPELYGLMQEFSDEMMRDSAKLQIENIVKQYHARGDKSFSSQGAANAGAGNQASGITPTFQSKEAAIKAVQAGEVDADEDGTIEVIVIEDGKRVIYEFVN